MFLNTEYIGLCNKILFSLFWKQSWETLGGECRCVPLGMPTHSEAGGSGILSGAYCG